MTASHTVEHPVELLTFVFACHQDVKKVKVRQWLKYGSVKVNGRSVTRYNHRLQAGDVVSIRGKEEVLSESLLPRGMTVLFEDESLVVIEKPANLLSMATPRERDKTAYSYLTDYIRRGNPQSPKRVWIVHRLDRETSGLMVFAKTEEAKQVLQANWLQAEKGYLAVVEGNLPASSGELSSEMDERHPSAADSAPPSQRTRLAVTKYRVLKRNATRALVELTPQTGSRNQIREHLADAKCPIIGDRKHKAVTNPARRLGLHASSLQFPHPLSGEILNFSSPLPRVLSRQV